MPTPWVNLKVSSPQDAHRLPQDSLGSIFPPWIPDSSLCSWNLDSGFQSLMAYCGIPDSWSYILDSKPHDSEFHKQNIPGFQIPQAKRFRIPEWRFRYMGWVSATLGTRGFSRVRREFSVLVEGRHIFGRRPKPRGSLKDFTETRNRARKVSGTQGK